MGRKALLAGCFLASGDDRLEREAVIRADLFE